MLRSVILIGTTGFWLTMMGLHIQHEFFEFNPIQTAYEILPLSDSYERDEYQNVHLGEHWIGFRQNLIGVPRSEEATKKLGEKAAHTNLAVASADNYRLSHLTYLTFRLLGRENEMLVRGKAELDNQLYLKAFNYTIKSQDAQTHIQGDVHKDKIELTLNDSSTQESKKVVPIKGKVLHSEALGFIWTPKNLVVGKQGTLKVWNPVMLSIEEIHFRVGPKETIRYDDTDTEVFVLYFTRDLIKTRAWVTPTGDMLRSETPTGLILEKRPAYEIYDNLRTEKAKIPDLPNLYSVTPDQSIPNIQNLEHLKIRLSSSKSKHIILSKRDDLTDLEKITWPLQIEDSTVQKSLEPSEYVQSENEMIRAKAREIIGDEKSLLKAALKIQTWLYENMTPTPTSSVPSAQNVFHTMKGDCNEYTTLFTAMTRSIGIPTQMVAGLMYFEGRFFYHAWPQIHLGRWVSLDPTLNQTPTDVGHIPLVQGDLREQIKLASQLGELTIEVLEYK